MEQTITLWGANDGEILDINDSIILNVLSIEDDGIFPTEEDWINFVSDVDTAGSYFLASNYVYNDNGSCDVHGIKVTFHFDRPIKVIVYNQVRNVNKMTVEVDYEWSILNKYSHLHCSTMIDILGKVIYIE